MRSVFLALEEPHRVSAMAARVEVCILFSYLAGTTVGITGAPSGVSEGAVGRSDGS